MSSSATVWGADSRADAMAASVAVAETRPAWLYWVALGVVFLLAAVSHGGRTLVGWHIAALLLAATAVVHVFRSARLATLTRWWPAVALPLYVAFQGLPIPTPLVSFLSPVRGGQLEQLREVIDVPTTASVSIDPVATLQWLPKCAAFVLMFLLMARLSADALERRSWVAVVPLAVLAACESALALWQSAGGLDVIGTFGSKNHLSGLLEMALPLATACAVGMPVARGWRRRSRAAWLLKAFFGVTALLCLAVIVDAGSKAGFAASLVGLATIGVVGAGTRYGGARRVLATVAALGSVALLFIALPSERLLDSLASVPAVEATSAEGRVPVWRDSLQILREFPVLGSGFGTFGTAFVGHQTENVDAAFEFAHNDYIQLATELGLGGFALLAALIGYPFGAAVYAAAMGRTSQSRTLAVGCLGSMAAIALHSIFDFNLYIPSNALTMAAIAGIAVSLTAPPAETANSQKVANGRWMTIALALGVALFALGWVAFDRLYRDHPTVERWFCEFGVCDNEARHVSFTGGTGRAAGVPLSELLTELRREPANPGRWADAGEELFKAGQQAKARYCMSTAVSLAPHVPSVLMRAAAFHQAVGEEAVALRYTSHVLGLTGSQDNAIFTGYRDWKVAPARVLAAGLPAQVRPAASYVRYLLEYDRPDEAQAVWAWMAEQRLLHEPLALYYVNHLFARRQYAEAAAAWADFLGTRGSQWGTRERVFNGSFETEPVTIPFDWRAEGQKEDVLVAVDENVSHRGTRSLRVRFGGRENVDFAGVSQTLPVQRGVYRFSAWAKTDGITTDRGVAFRLLATDGKAVNVTVPVARGTSDWTRLEAIVNVPDAVPLLVVRLEREKSLRFDSLIAGTVWIDDVSLEKMP